MSTPWSLCDRRSGDVLLPHLELATSFWQRFRGLQLRSSLPEGHGLLLAPCNALHTFFVRFPIDVAFLDSTGRVIATIEDLRPWRIVPPLAEAFAILELPPESLPLAAGDCVAIRGDAGLRLPTRLAELRWR